MTATRIDLRKEISNYERWSALAPARFPKYHQQEETLLTPRKSPLAIRLKAVPDKDALIGAPLVCDRLLFQSQARRLSQSVEERGLRDHIHNLGHLLVIKQLSHPQEVLVGDECWIDRDRVGKLNDLAING